VREPPVGLPVAQVLAAVRRHWDDQVDRVEHLPVVSEDRVVGLVDMTAVCRILLRYSS